MGSFDKSAGTCIFVNKLLDPGIFDKNPMDKVRKVEDFPLRNKQG
jgi:hypothetical protein